MTWQPETRLLVAERALERARALTVPCPFCYEPTGQPCVNRSTGDPVVHQPAHFQRIRAVTAGGG